MIKKNTIWKIVFFSVLLLNLFVIISAVSENSDKFFVSVDDLTNNFDSTTIQKEENGGGGPQYIPIDNLILFLKEDNGGGGPQYIPNEDLVLFLKEDNGSGGPQLIED